MLIPIDILANSFYQVEEMISYHQSGYIAEYLIANYGIQKFEALWKSGLTSFEAIYGFTDSQLAIELNKHILEIHPTVPQIDWEVVKKGCN